jgi:chemotaxis methyl-accepting protein methylase
VGLEINTIAMPVMDFTKTQTVLRPEHFETVATDISPSELDIDPTEDYDDFARNSELPGACRKYYFEKKGRFCSVFLSRFFFISNSLTKSEAEINRYD